AGGHEGDVAQRAPGPLLAGRLQTQPDPEVLHLRCDTLQALRDAVHQDPGILAVGGSAMGDDDRGAQGSSQLHGVFQGCQALASPLGILGGERGEVGGVDRKPHSPLGSLFTELRAASLLPRAIRDERQFERREAALEASIEVLTVVDTLRRELGDSYRDHGHQTTAATAPWISPEPRLVCLPPPIRRERRRGPGSVAHNRRCGTRRAAPPTGADPRWRRLEWRGTRSAGSRRAQT